MRVQNAGWLRTQCIPHHAAGKGHARFDAGNGKSELHAVHIAFGYRGFGVGIRMDRAFHSQRPYDYNLKQCEGDDCNLKGCKGDDYNAKVHGLRVKS